MKQREVTFPCGDIVLEGAWHLPDGAGKFPVVVVCHPHPLYGGDMWNNVVMAICDALPRKSIAAFRFNFRGVGRSGGAHGGGIAERGDVKAALSFVSSSQRVDAQKLGLAGYSFGASVAVPVAVEDERVKLLALVSPALSDSGWKEAQKYTMPKLLLSGSEDSVISQAQFERYAKSLHEPRQYAVLPGIDHFWLGFETDLGKKVADFFSAGFCKATP
ncbi:MAG: dienelactone hydrolase family protein [Chloroflexi bacterium]|nr:dienelactone hydrolase family protein [Chloroflexota bacterium]